MAWLEFRKTKNGVARKQNKKTGQWETGSWYGLGRDPKTGERISMPVGVRENWRKVRDEIEAIETGAVERTPTSPTLREAYRDFEQIVLRRGGSPLTWVNYKQALDKLVKFLGESAEIHTITTKDLKRFKIHLLDSHTVNGMFSILGPVRTFFSACVEQEFIKVNPASKITKGLKPQKVATFLTDEQVKCVLAQIDTAGVWKDVRGEFRDIINTVLLTGMRESDVANFKCSWVQDGMIYITNGKGNKSRTIPVVPMLANLLAKYLNRGNEYVFQGWQRSHRLSLYWWRLYRAAQKKCPGLPKRCRFHDLRHTFAKNFLSGGGDLKRLQMILGHSKIGVTADIYGHLDVADLVEDMGRVRAGWSQNEPALKVV